MGAQHVGQCCVRVGVARIDGERTLQHGSRVVQAVQRSQYAGVVEKRAEVVGPLAQCLLELGARLLPLALRGKHRTEDDSRLRKIRAALQRARQQLLGARKLAANVHQLAEVVIRRRVGRVGSEDLLV